MENGQQLAGTPLAPGHVDTVMVPAAAPPLELASSTKPRRLDLACGQRCKEGFEGVDLLAAAEHKVDLFKFPWPFEDDSVDEIHCSHFVEHIPLRDVELRDLVDPNPQTIERWIGVDMFFAFFDEAWRILRHGAAMKVIVPSLKSDRAFQDPTHRRFIPMAAFVYLNRQWLEGQGIPHYRTRCNFDVNVNPTIPQDLSLRSPEVQMQKINECWNTTFDLVADLVAVKKST